MAQRYEYRNVRGHIEVYSSGQFIMSADTKEEAVKEVMTIDSGIQRG